MAAALHGRVWGVGGVVWVWGVCLLLWGCVGLCGGATAAAGVVFQLQLEDVGGGPPMCRGLHKAAVDWWVMLKHPGGYAYSYVDSSSFNSSSSLTAGACPGGVCWRHGLSMQNPNPVSHTLQQLAPTAAAAADRLAYFIYNDADPGGTEHFEFAHAKGVVAFSDVSVPGNNSSNSSAAGFWLVHSAPRFPGIPAAGPGWMQLQHPQTVFGQHFSCFSLAGNSSIAAVAQALLAAGPFIYSSNLPTRLAAAYPPWLQLLAGGFASGPVAVATSFFSSKNSTKPQQQQTLLAFAKSRWLNVSLTDAVVGPGLGVDMFWETWRRSHDALPSACPPPGVAGGDAPGTARHSSLNVDRVSFPGTRFSWDWAQDHSKWGVSNSNSGSNNGSNNGTMFVCLGDMNRAGWQAHRGGSYVCMQHAGLCGLFHGLLAAAEPCRWHVA